MVNVLVDLETHEIFKLLKEKRGTNSMHEAVRDALLDQLSDDDILTIQRRVELRQKYMDMAAERKAK